MDPSDGELSPFVVEGLVVDGAEIVEGVGVFTVPPALYATVPSEESYSCFSSTVKYESKRMVPGRRAKIWNCTSSSSVSVSPSVPREPPYALDQPVPYSCP